jgi:uncharacterized protein YuzE
MKVIYDRETDTLSIILRNGKVADSDEVREGLIMDYDKSGRLLSIELLDASEQVNQPQCRRVRAGRSVERLGPVRGRGLYSNPGVVPSIGVPTLNMVADMRSAAAIL